MALDPIVEGRATPVVPEWLEPYVEVAPAKRDALSTPEQILFDTYWRRATGEVKPALSGRERGKLLSYLER